MKLAIIGDPVEHSGSPRLHEGFLREANVEGSYVAMRVALPDAVATIRRLHADGYTGCNVTYPLKEEARNACDAITSEGERVAAVNTIFFGRAILGTNTDGFGARLAVETLLDEPVALKRVGVLGYGATGRAILAELHDNDAYTFLWGRDEERVAAACVRYEALPWPKHDPPEIVISTLPPQVDWPQWLIAEMRFPDVVMDANYGGRSVLSERLGREVVDGKAMLEAQARASFDFWMIHAGA